MLHRSILVLAALASLSPSAWADITLYLSPPEPSLEVGTTFQIEFGASGLEGQAALSGYDVTVGYDYRRVSFDEVRFGDDQFGDQLHLDSAAPAPQSASHLDTGLIQLLEVSQDAATVLELAQPDFFRLATLRFHAQNSGTAEFTLTLNELSDASAQPMPASAIGTRVEIVPLPATFLPTASAMLVLLLISKTGHRQRERL
ncbi:cohesin domain-containing protein [Methyloterricola oryzae]|uniref:cohesin domain-containing protein n=1 Tax=Methyloterricola oryzae TaxID=1495050 RepID=UPI0005EB7B60|nr:cohesin domain-containing protein [Methyloterricola oryzae]